MLLKVLENDYEGLYTFKCYKTIVKVHTLECHTMIAKGWKTCYSNRYFRQFSNQTCLPITQ